MSYTTEAHPDAIRSLAFPNLLHVGDYMAMVKADWALTNRLAGQAEQAARDAVADRRTDRAGAMLMVRRYKAAHATYLAAHARFFVLLGADRAMQVAA